MARGCFQDIRFFVACYGFLMLTDIMAGVMKKSSLTTIERRFDLPSSVTALLASSFQLGTLTMLPFVSYFGSRWHRPRTLFFGSVLLVLGNLIVTLPQFIGGRYEYEDAVVNVSESTARVGLCQAGASNSTTPACEEYEETSTNKLYILLVVGMMINGVGGSTVQPLGISYIDDFAHERNSPFYLGLTSSIALLGPMFGYILSSVVLRWWVDIGWVDTSNVRIKPTHPNWVGAWWLGLLICTSGIAIAVIPLWFFPKKMKKQELKKKKRASDDTEVNGTEMEKSAKDDDDNKVKNGDNSGKKSPNELRRFLDTLKRFRHNTEFQLILLKFWSGSAAVVGIVNFFPKFLEVNFGVSASRANLLTGIINIPCAVVGTLAGGSLMKLRNPNMAGIAKIIAFATFCATLCTLPLLFVGCETIDIAGLTVPYSDSPADTTEFAELSVISDCNNDCNCKDGTYSPVCGADGTSYISPCHAGCREQEVDETGMITNFTDCACVNPSAAQQNQTTSQWARRERCQFTKCADLLNVALAFKGAANFFAGLAGSPMYIYLVRSVDPRDKAFAIGIELLLIRLLAWIPGPIVFGAAIDSACLYWGSKPCSNRGYCKVYDNDRYRYTFYAIVGTAQVLSCATAILLYIASKRKVAREAKERPNEEGDDEKEQDLDSSDAPPPPEDESRPPDYCHSKGLMLDDFDKPLLSSNDVECEVEESEAKV